MVFTKKADGSYGCDLSLVERYLDSAIKAACRPKNRLLFVLFGDPAYGDCPQAAMIFLQERSHGQDGRHYPGPSDLPMPGDSEPFCQQGEGGSQSRGCTGSPAGATLGGLSQEFWDGQVVLDLLWILAWAGLPCAWRHEQMTNVYLDINEKRCLIGLQAPVALGVDQEGGAGISRSRHG